MMEHHLSSERTMGAVSRRQFLKGVGAAVTATFAACMTLPHSAALAEAAPELEMPGILIDLTRCVGCGSCARACKIANGLPDPDVAPEGLSKDAYSTVDEVKVNIAGQGEAVRYVKRQCMHCLEPACATACPAAAMHKSEEGAVIYRANRCLGCRYCQVACPFGVPAFDWQNPITPRISKCWFCYERQLRGEAPACAGACPTGALRFGVRSELLAEAHGRIASAPARYVDHVYGEHEVGGTSMLYVSDVPFEELGFPVGLGDEPPSVATEKIMQALPAVILGVGALATGTAVYTHKFAAHEHNHASRPEATEIADHREQEE